MNSFKSIFYKLHNWLELYLSRRTDQNSATSGCRPAITNKSVSITYLPGPDGNIFQNYRGETIWFYKQDDLLCKDNFERFHSSLISRSQLELSDGLKLLENLYGLTDNWIDLFKPFCSCSAGCSSCCCQLVETWPLEAEYIRDYVHDNFNYHELKLLIKRIKACSRHQKPYENLYTTNKNSPMTYQRLENYYNKLLPCPFLTEEKLCMIYQARPMNCRLHFVYNSPEKCLPGNNYIGRSEIISQYSIDTLIELSKLCTVPGLTNQNSNLLPLWFRKGFDRVR